jgi:hypothetical protein
MRTVGAQGIRRVSYACWGRIEAAGEGVSAPCDPALTPSPMQAETRPAVTIAATPPTRYPVSVSRD